jgi:hypothetical protein
MCLGSNAQIIMMIILAINKFAAVPVLVPCLVFTFVFHVACLLLFRVGPGALSLTGSVRVCLPNCLIIVIYKQSAFLNNLLVFHISAS